MNSFLLFIFIKFARGDEKRATAETYLKVLGANSKTFLLLLLKELKMFREVKSTRIVYKSRALTKVH